MRFLLVWIFIFFPLVALSQEVHFFGSADYARTNVKNNAEIDFIRNEWTLSRLITTGVNFSTRVDEKSSALVQFVYILNQDVIVELVQYQKMLPHGVRIRVGKQRHPSHLMSEFYQIKALYPWAVPPLEVYNKAPVRTFTGVSLEKDFNNFTVHLFGGDASQKFVEPISTYQVDTENLFGIRLNANLNDLMVFATYFKTNVDLSLQRDVEIAPGVFAAAKGKARLNNFEGYSGGFNWRKNDWWVLSEYTRDRSDSSVIKFEDAAYISIGRFFTEKFLLLPTFSTDFSRESTLGPSKTTTYAMNFLYRLDPNAVLKLGVSHVNYREETVASPFSPTGTSNGATGYSEAPDGNYALYDLQVAFVF